MNVVFGVDTQVQPRGQYPAPDAGQKKNKVNNCCLGQSHVDCRIIVFDIVTAQINIGNRIHYATKMAVAKLANNPISNANSVLLGISV